jgi:hypothetical protein
VVASTTVSQRVSFCDVPLNVMYRLLSVKNLVKRFIDRTKSLGWCHAQFVPEKKAKVSFYMIKLWACLQFPILAVLEVCFSPTLWRLCFPHELVVYIEISTLPTFLILTSANGNLNHCILEEEKQRAGVQQ